MTRFLISKLVKILLLVVVCGGIIIFCINEVSARGILKNNPLEKVGLQQVTWQNAWSTISNAKLPQTENFTQLQNQTGDQLKTLGERSLAVSKVAQGFVQTQLISSQAPSTTSSTNAANSSVTPTLAPLEQRAFDYARYLYCQAAIKDYEQLHPEVKP
jgi:hypothetical protein